jgi:hypothetical protein
VRGWRQGFGPLYSTALPPRPMVPGSWRRGPMALGFPDAVGCGIRVWPHRPVLPTVGVSPNTVGHGGRNYKRRGLRRQIYISRKFWFDHLFFENPNKLNIKKSSWVRLPPMACVAPLRRCATAPPHAEPGRRRRRGAASQPASVDERTLWCLEGGWIGSLQISETKAAD